MATFGPEITLLTLCRGQLLLSHAHIHTQNTQAVTSRGRPAVLHSLEGSVPCTGWLASEKPLIPLWTQPMVWKDQLWENGEEGVAGWDGMEANQHVFLVFFLKNFCSGKIDFPCHISSGTQTIQRLGWNVTFTRFSGNWRCMTEGLLGLISGNLATTEQQNLWRFIHSTQQHLVFLFIGNDTSRYITELGSDGPTGNSFVVISVTLWHFSHISIGLPSIPLTVLSSATDSEAAFCLLTGPLRTPRIYLPSLKIPWAKVLGLGKICGFTEPPQLYGMTTDHLFYLLETRLKAETCS